MPRYHSAIHGNSFLPGQMVDGYLEPVDGQPYTDVVGRPIGTGKKFQLGNRSGIRIFHGPIALLGFIADQRALIDKLFFFFSTGSDAGVVRIELWGTQGSFWSWVPPSDPSNTAVLSGDWSTPRTRRGGTSGRSIYTNVYEVRGAGGAFIEVLSAVNLVVHVEGSSNNPRGGGAAAQITFHGAGLDLLI